MQDLPLIDLSQTASLAGEVEAACRDIGFMYVANHGIAETLMNDVRASIVQDERRVICVLGARYWRPGSDCFCAGASELSLQSRV